MKSGIYKLVFSSGYYYIGRSYDIENRYEQHIESMNSGSAARPLQGQFAQFGSPKLIIIHEAHSDYLPWLESYYINKLDSPLMLNTTKSLVDYDVEVYDKDIFKLSIDETLTYLTSFKRQGQNLLKALEEVQEQRSKEEIEADVYDQIRHYQVLSLEYIDKCKNMSDEISRLKTRNLWERIWNV